MLQIARIPAPCAHPHARLAHRAQLVPVSVVWIPTTCMAPPAYSLVPPFTTSTYTGVSHVLVRVWRAHHS